MNKISSVIIVLMFIFVFGGCGSDDPSYIPHSTSSIAQEGIVYTEADDISKITEDMIHRINEMDNLYEKAKFSFDAINKNTNGLKVHTFMRFSISVFEDFLKTEQSYEMTETDYASLSENIRVFKLSSGNIISYEANPLVFGESGAPIYTFYQAKTYNEIDVIELFPDNTRHILSVFCPVNHLFILSGIEKDIRPDKAFIDGFSIENDTVERIEVLENYHDDYWKIDAESGLILRFDNTLLETFLNDDISPSVEIDSKDNRKIKLAFDNQVMKYTVVK